MLCVFILLVSLSNSYETLNIGMMLRFWNHLMTSFNGFFNNVIYVSYANVIKCLILHPLHFSTNFFNPLHHN